MSIINEIGKVTEKSRNWKFEWQIQNFFSYFEKDAMYRSPDFHVSDNVLYLKICPMYKSNDDYYVDYASLFLCKVSCKMPSTIKFEIGIKTAHNEIVNIHNSTWLPDKLDWGWKMFIERFKLLEERAKLVPRGVLTIICFVKLEENTLNVNASNNLAENYKDLFISKRNTDVTFNVKRRKIAAHRLILGARSPVFAAMFNSDMTEKASGVVNISDFDPEDVKVFLLFLYSGILEYDKCNIFQLYKLADKYDVSDLKSVCIDFMIKNLSTENFSETLLLGNQFHEKELKVQVQMFFNENFQNIVCSDSWESLFKENFRLANNLLKMMSKKVKLMP